MLGSLLTGGLLGPGIISAGLTQGPAPATPPFYTDPDAARAVPIFIADPASFYVDPDAALEVKQ